MVHGVFKVWLVFKDLWYINNDDVNLVLDVPRLFKDSTNQRTAELQLNVGIQSIGRRHCSSQECDAALRCGLAHIACATANHNGHDLFCLFITKFIHKVHT